jgi:hypothetical protein
MNECKHATPAALPTLAGKFSARVVGSLHSLKLLKCTDRGKRLDPGQSRLITGTGRSLLYRYGIPLSSGSAAIAARGRTGTRRQPPYSWECESADALRL